MLFHGPRGALHVAGKHCIHDLPMVVVLALHSRSMQRDKTLVAMRLFEQDTAEVQKPRGAAGSADGVMEAAVPFHP
jgi:hypothetical protein